jgi:anti-sigma factor RsiW
MSLVLPRHLTCKEVVELVTRYDDGDLDADDRTRFELHLATCGACVTYYDQMRLTIDALGAHSHHHDAPLDPMIERALLSAFAGTTSGEP